MHGDVKSERRSGSQRLASAQKLLVRLSTIEWQSRVSHEEMLALVF